MFFVRSFRLLSTLFLAAFIFQYTDRSAAALPEFSRKYGVGCQTCHTVPPRLNLYGLAFQANHFNEPDGQPMLHARSSAVPISGLLTASMVDDRSARHTDTNFRSLELFSSDGFR